MKVEYLMKVICQNSKEAVRLMYVSSIPFLPEDRMTVYIHDDDEDFTVASTSWYSRRQELLVFLDDQFSYLDEDGNSMHDSEVEDYIARGWLRC